MATESTEKTKAQQQTQAATQTAAHSLQGNVIKAGADKTITVLIERKIKHPLYKKYIRRSTKVHAHDEKNECRVGDNVVVETCRPLSKTKSWRLLEVVSKGA